MTKNNITIELNWLEEEYCTVIKQNSPQAWMVICCICCSTVCFHSFKQSLVFLTYFKYNSWKKQLQENVCSDVSVEEKGTSRREKPDERESGPEWRVGGVHPNQRGHLRWKWSPGWRWWAGYWFVLAGVRHGDKLSGNPEGDYYCWTHVSGPIRERGCPWTKGKQRGQTLFSLIFMEKMDNRRHPNITHWPLTLAEELDRSDTVHLGTVYKL